MAIIAVANLKGGVGKSTIAVNLACALKARLVDADAQGTAARWASSTPIDVDSLPLDTEREAAAWINRVLALTASNIVIDCPPHVGAATSAAIGIADLVLVPVTPSAADLAATMPALALIGDARERRRDGGPKCLLIPSRVDWRTAAGRELAKALEGMGEPVGPEIRQRQALTDAVGAGEWIGVYQPRGDAAADFKALAAAVKRRTR